MKIAIPQGLKHYAVDLLDRVGGTFVESMLGGMTASGLTTITGHGSTWALIINTAAYSALFALVKGIGGGLIPGTVGAALLPGTVPTVNASAATLAKASGADAG